MLHIVIEYTVKSCYIFKEAEVGPFVGSIAKKVTRFEFCNFRALNPLKVAKERFPFFRVKLICFDFISFFKKRKKLWKVGNFISQLTCPNIVSAYEKGKINLQFCV